METNKIIQGDSLEELRKLPKESIDCCITSPPYWGLRDYGVEGQLGLEKTPEEYTEKMVEIFREVKRVLKKEGTCWLNLGDSYASTAQGTYNAPQKKAGDNEIIYANFRPKIGLAGKQLIGIPWRIAFALQKDGWYLRQDIIWAKPNPMPESVTDRCTKSHEYVFLLTKSPKYYYDNEAIREPVQLCSIARLDRAISNKHKNINGAPGQTPHTFAQPRLNKKYKRYEKSNAPHEFEGADHLVSPFDPEKGRNKRSVWTITTKPYKEAHFATFPEELIEPMIMAGSPKEICNKCGKVRERIVERKRLTRPELSKDDPRYRPNTYKGTYAEINGKADAGYTAVKTIGFTDCGCNEGFSGGIVLDIFMGAGTTGLVAKKLGREYMGIELNPEYIKIAEERLRGQPKPIL